jgi:DNA modification methylase
MDMVWKKRNKTGGLQSKHRPMKNHEMVYFFYEQAPKYNRDKYHKRIAKKEHNIPKDSHQCTQGKSSKMEKIRNHFEPPNPASVLEEDEPVSMFESTKVFIGKRHHQTEKPLDILEFFLKYWSNEGETILDPTMGSGSTGVACKKMGRKFIGFELDPKIYEVAKKRLDQREHDIV